MWGEERERERGVGWVWGKERERESPGETNQIEVKVSGL